MNSILLHFCPGVPDSSHSMPSLNALKSQSRGTTLAIRRKKTDEVTTLKYNISHMHNNVTGLSQDRGISFAWNNKMK